MTPPTRTDSSTPRESLRIASTPAARARSWPIFDRIRRSLAELLERARRQAAVVTTWSPSAELPAYRAARRSCAVRARLVADHLRHTIAAAASSWLAARAVVLDDGRRSPAGAKPGVLNRAIARGLYPVRKVCATENAWGWVAGVA